MTTVAYKDGTIVSDGRVTDDGHILSNKFKKIVKTDRHLVGVCGDCDFVQTFLDWAKTNFDPVKAPSIEYTEFSALVVDEDLNVSEYSDSLRPIRYGKVPFMSVGSGSKFAIGAMAFGATALEAVKLACKHDAYSSGTPFVESFTVAKKSKKK